MNTILVSYFFRWLISVFQNSMCPEIISVNFYFLNVGTFAPYVLECGGPHRHEEQKIKGVVENKPLPVISNDAKVVAGKMFKRKSN